MAVLYRKWYGNVVISDKSILARLVHPSNILSTGFVFAFVKYPNSSNDVISVFPLKAVPMFALAAAAVDIPVPSPIPAATNTLSTSGSAKYMYVESAVIFRFGYLTAIYYKWCAYAAATLILPETVEIGLLTFVVSTPSVKV